jgi:hypothetical protein
MPSTAAGVRRPLKLRRRAGAGDGSRTRDMQLGRLPLYQLSYSRPRIVSLASQAVAASPILEPSLPRRALRLMARMEEVSALRPEDWHAQLTWLAAEGLAPAESAQLLVQEVGEWLGSQQAAAAA